MNMKQEGFSLTELLIGLLLSSLIMAGLLHIYLYCKNQYDNYQKRLLNMLDVQWISYQLIQSIREAGFTPCMKMKFLTLEDKRSHVQKPLQAFLIENAPEQSLTLQRMDSRYGRLLETQGFTNLLVASDTALSTEYPILVSDCVHGEVHELSEISQTAKGQSITLKKPLVFDYPYGAFVGIFIEEKWFIKNKASLYYKHTIANELSALIHSMEIEQFPHRLEISLGLDQCKIWRVIAGFRNA